MKSRDEILQRIANLRARATDDGSSEAEANAAMERAQALMEAYQVEEAELALAEGEGRIKIEIVHLSTKAGKEGKIRHKVQTCLWYLQQFTHTRCVIKGDGTLEFTGHKPDVELVLYLVDVIRTALDREYDRWKRQAGAVGRGAKASFQWAMANRINERLRELIQEQNVSAHERQVSINAPGGGTGTELIIADFVKEKRREVETAFTARNPRLRKVSMRGTINNGSAYTAGRQAGDRVHLGRSINAENQRQIA